MDARQKSASRNDIHPLFQVVRNLLVSFTIAISVAACGGGAAPEPMSAAALPADSELNEPDEFFLFQDYAIKAANRYGGETKELGFTTNESVAAAISNAMFGAIENSSLVRDDPNYYYHWLGIPFSTLTTDIPFIDINAKRRSFPISRQHTCDTDSANPGTADIDRKSGTLDSGEDAFWFTFNYQNCKERGNKISYTGAVELLFVRERSEQINSVLLAYNDVTLLKGGRRYLVTGTIKIYYPTACGRDGERVHYLHIQDLETGESVFLENFIIGRYDRSDHPCDGYSSDSNYFHGRVYNSQYGAFRVSTPAPLGNNVTSYPKLQPYLSESADKTTQLGELSIKSLSDEISIGLSNSTYMSEDPKSTIPKNAALISISRAGQLQPDDIIHNIALFKSGSFLDLSDDDGDEMNNSWEELVGLDKTNPDDKDSDDDGDSRSSLLEFMTGGHPAKPGVRGSSIDRRLEVNTTHTKYLYGVIRVEMSLYSDNDDPFLSSSNIVLSANVGGTWEFNDGQCEVNETNELVCVAQVKSYNAQFRPSEDGHVTIDSYVSNSNHDLNVENNSVRNEVDYAATQYDFEVRTQAKSIISASDNGEQSISAQIINNFGKNSHGLELEIAIPDGITVKSVNATVDRVRVGSCTTTDTVACYFRELNLHEPLQLEVFFDFHGPDPVIFEWNVAQHLYEKVTSNNSAITQIIKAQNTSEIEQLIHNADDGDSIELPPGHYDGKLFLRNKSLNISGSTGPEPTWLYTFRDSSYSFVQPGSNTVIQNIRFMGPGTPIVFDSGDYLTVQNNHFVASNVLGEKTKTLIGSTYPSRAEHPARNAAYRFINNRLVGFGRVDKSPCDQLLTANGWRTTIVEGNLFDSVYCDNGIIGTNTQQSNQTASSHLLAFDRNTIVKSGTVLGYQMSAQYSAPFHLSLSNNIFYNIDKFVTDDSLAQLYLSTKSLTSLNNLVHLTNSGKVLGLLEEDPTSIWVDPKFSNDSVGDYSLQQHSPAVDSWMEPQHHSEVLRESDLFDFQPTITFTDGNFDGIVTPDIGAFELAL